jgi:hypothetical protein
VSKYDPLRDRLIASRSQSVKMTFAEIEVLIGRSLPKSAYAYATWWANENPEITTHSHIRAWTSAGYKAKLDPMKRAVTFRRKS